MKKHAAVVSIAGVMLLATLMSAGANGKKFGSTYMTLNNPFFIALNDGIKAVLEANAKEHAGLVK